MSNRVLKKLQGANDLVKTDGQQSETEDEAPNVSSSSEAANKCKKLAANRFELLTGEQSLSDTAKEDDDRENEPPMATGGGVGEEDGAPVRGKLEKQDSAQSTDSLKRRKKKKKKKKQKQLSSQHSSEAVASPLEDEVAASLREVNQLLGEPGMANEGAEASSGASLTRERSLLSVDPRHLSPENEMRRIFGSRVVQSEQAQKRRGRGRAYTRAGILVPGRDWSHIGKPGVSMELVETQGNVQHFTFVHSRQYQAVQFQFLDAVETFNPDNIVALLNLHPYHVDALIQFSDVCRVGEDLQMAAELIERALCCLEGCFHPLFNVTQGNCRLDYRRAENRSFFLALFKHLLFVGQRGCSRTALEFCKLLLGLDPDGDPLCVLLVLDYFALRAEQYTYLVRVFREWDPYRNLGQLPNWSFSLALALFHMGERSEADLMLQGSLIMFPGVLMPLLDKCGVQPDPVVAGHRFFGLEAQAQQNPGLSHLVSLFVGRHFVLWKEPPVLAWLEENVKVTLQQVDRGDPKVKEAEEKRKKRYLGTPRNISRHILLSNIKEANLTLPQELANAPIFGFDPLPPADAIVTYTRPPRSQQMGDQGMVSAFFRSLLPSFNLPREVVGIEVNDPAPLEGMAAAGAAVPDGAHAADGGDLRRSVTSLLEAMRDLLSNIHLPSPNEGDIDSDDEHED